jgi:hypothetical protein
VHDRDEIMYCPATHGSAQAVLFYRLHYLRNEGLDVSNMSQPAIRSERAEVYGRVARIIRLIIILREKVQEPLIVRLITTLERIHEHQLTAGA